MGDLRPHEVEWPVQVAHRSRQHNVTAALLFKVSNYWPVCLEMNSLNWRNMDASMSEYRK